ncbi:DUF484 family protein [Sphingomonas sp. BIUV-7]|uniref:DUF484 family protein n=1 Tax=Sphingomonas natans TaxID=3063330 RepID=A0ABT8Y3K3_9SPHN|nr:DUF484 family protein [Sphingomonas sp. BIUV-7]MDO6412883.1 DUF484 family protein [Sphingomonas sp. BIUV-7]
MQGNVHEHGSVASLRRRIAEAEQTNGELLAFARGHTGAAHAIHEAVLAVMEADCLDTFAAIVTRDWPALLGVDAAAFAWSADGIALAADETGVRPFEPRLVVRMAGIDRAVTIRQVDRGHPLFGKGAPAIRSEIAIRLAGARGIGLILLGEEEATSIDAPAATRLLRFLGRSASVMLERWSLN